MRYLSVCSGIEAASCAWHWLGWTPVGFAEIEPFPSAVLAHHYPGVKNYGDFTSIARSPELIAEIGHVDVLVGGTPCQSFSVAGLRGGLSDERGNLALEFFRLAEAVKPRWILWENVPGVLSSGSGRDYGAILGALAYLGYGYAWRVLDAQFFGVPQRRRRVFLVGHSGGACESPATVLFEPEGVRRDPPQKRKAGKDAAHAARAGATERGEREPGDIAGTFVPAVSCAVTSKWHKGTGGGAGDECQNLVSQPQPIPFATTQLTHPPNRSNPQPGDPCHPLAAGAHPPAVAMVPPGTLAPTLDARGGRSGETGFATSGGLVPVGFNWQNGGGYGQAHDGLGITEDGIPPLSRSQVPAVAFQSNLSNHGTQSEGVTPTLTADAPMAVATATGAVTHALTANGHDASEDGTGRGTPLVARECARGEWVNTSASGTLDTRGTRPRAALISSALLSVGVRRLTPRECERLQGFPDDWTLIEVKPGKPAADGPRYKALGNSMAVPVMYWIGKRIAQVDRDGPYQGPPPANE